MSHVNATNFNGLSKLENILSQTEVSNPELTKEIQTLTGATKEQQAREDIKEEDIDVVEKALTHFLQLSNTDIVVAYNGLTECCRLLRNMCVQCTKTQDNILPCIKKIKSVIASCKELKRGIHKSESESSTVLFRCIVQFIGNSIVGHPRNQQFVWDNLQDELSELLYYGDEKLTTYTCMIYHNCLRGLLNRESSLDVVHCGKILCDVVNSTVDQESEYGLFTVEDCLEVDGTLAEADPELSDNEMLFVLEILIDNLKKLPPNSHEAPTSPHPSLGNLRYLVTQIVTHATSILNVIEQKLETNPHIIAKQIEVLGLATSQNHLYGDLQNEPDLLTTCLYLLHSIHRLGQSGDNIFSSVQKAREAEQVDVHHPAFGLKKDIIRLLANLVHGHHENQDKVREMDGLPLILDQTNIDARNPYISQWAILAVHNLCEGNPENQKLLSDLRIQGVCNKSAVIEELGIEVELKDGKVSVKPKSQDR
ncbi:ataxin-10-like [Crassostrea virginica]